MARHLLEKFEERIKDPIHGKMWSDLLDNISPRSLLFDIALSERPYHPCKCVAQSLNSEIYELVFEDIC